jgi:predicted Zn-dependent protease with MMP-like domain
MWSVSPRRVSALLLLWCGLWSGLTAAGSAARAEPFRWLVINGAQARWVVQGAEPLTLRYAIVKTEMHTANARNCGGMAPPTGLLTKSALSDDVFRTAVAHSFAAWQEHINVNFEETNDQHSADIAIGEQSDPTGFAFADVSVGAKTSDEIGQITKAAICLNPLKKWKIGYDGDLAVYDLVHTISHEIGHAIGLDHPSRNGHLMSFRYGELSSGLSEGDVLGAVKLYGRRSDPSSTATNRAASRD